MRHGSLFSGIGGFDLAAEWMGWENVFHCEWEDFPRKVLKHYWPKAKSYGDITKTDFTIHRGEIDILTGGFPCQPYSQAGNRLGKEDDRHLWPDMLRAIREISPTWVVGENVLGLINWNGGMVFDEVQADLEAEGYQVQPFLLPACGVNAPHRRDRIWFVAYCNGTGLQEARTEDPTTRTSRSVIQRAASDTKSERQQAPADCRESLDSQEGAALYGRERDARTTSWENFPTQSPVCDGDDGVSQRLDGITFHQWRKESIKSGGNAIVPQVALQIFKSIEQYEILNH